MINERFKKIKLSRRVLCHVNRSQGHPLTLYDVNHIGKLKDAVK